MEITIEIPDELATTLRRTPEELRYDLRLRALAGLVERGLLSTGRAAELARVSRREFLDWCGRWHLRIHRWTTPILPTTSRMQRAVTPRDRLPQHEPAHRPRSYRPAGSAG